MESYKIWSSWPKDDQKPITCCFLGSHIPKNSIESNTWKCLEFQNPQKFPKTDRWFERFKKIGCKANGFLSPKCWRPCRSFALDEPHSWKGSASDARMETKSNPLGGSQKPSWSWKGDPPELLTHPSLTLISSNVFSLLGEMCPPHFSHLGKKILGS